MMSYFKAGDTAWTLHTNGCELYGCFGADEIHVTSFIVDRPPSKYYKLEDVFHTRREVLEALAKRLNELLKEE